jgi:hypothetical protein
MYTGEAPTSNVGKLMVLPIEKHEEKTLLLAEAFGMIVYMHLHIYMFIYILCVCKYIYIYIHIHIHMLR